KAGRPFLHLEDARAQLFEVVVDLALQALDGRGHGDDRQHADDDAQERQARAQLVGRKAAQDASHRVEDRANHSYLSDSIGSSRAARQAGKVPKPRPMIAETVTPSAIACGVTSAATGVAAAKSCAPPTPRIVPPRPPMSVTTAASVRNCRRIVRR